MTTEQDVDLNALLARSAPPVSTASPRVRQEVQVLVREATTGASHAPVRRVRGRRRLAIGAGAVAVAFMGVSTAAASPSAPAWLAWADWIPDRTVAEPPGHCALLGIKVVAHLAPDDDPAVVAARQYLAGLDVSDVDISEELAEQRSMPVTGIDGAPTHVPAEELYSDAELEYWAYTSAISQMIHDEVQRQGLSTEHVSIEGRADGCTPETSR